MAAARAIAARRSARGRAAWPAAACAAAAAVVCAAAGRAGAFARAPLSGAAVAPRAGGRGGRGPRQTALRAEGAVDVLTSSVSAETRTVTLEPGKLGIEIAEKTGRVLDLGDGAAKDAGVGQGWTFIEVEGYEFDVNTLASYSQGDRSYEVVLAMPRPNPTAVFDTNYGTIKAEIWLDRTPITASNFIDLARMGFYDDLHFHRIIPGFMAQFGCPFSRELPFDANKLGTGGPAFNLKSFVNLVNGRSVARRGGNIPDEFSSEDSNVPGTLSMANAGPNSGGSQFFFNVGQNANLDWFSEGLSKHPVFGQVTEGYDVVEKITQAKAYPTDIPIENIKVSKVTIEGL